MGGFSFHLKSTLGFMFPSSSQKDDLFLRPSSSCQSFPSRLLHLLHSYTSGLCKSILLLSLVNFWYLKRKSLQVTAMPRRLSKWLDLLLRPPEASNILPQWFSFCLTDIEKMSNWLLVPLSSNEWQTNLLLSCSKFAMVPRGILLNLTLAVPFSVVGKALHITSSIVIRRCIKVLNDSMWSKRSFKLSYDSSWKRRNFGIRGRFKTSMVNGEYGSSSHSVQVFHGFVFYCIPELVHFSSHATEFTFHSGWIFFWCHCSSVNLADRLHFIIVSFNSSRLFFFILIFGSPLLFLILGFKYSSQFFILASQLYYIGYCRCLVATRPPIAATLVHLSFYLSARVWYGMKVCCTSGVWLEYESILRKLPRVSEIATNHWVFLRCD